MRIFVTSLAIVLMFTVSAFKVKEELTIISADFTEGGVIPIRYTCEGKDINPPLQVSGAPANTKSLALIVDDPDAPLKGGFTHWVMWNIPLSGDISEDYKGAMQGYNGAKKKGYIGMCPPNGTHHYYFKVYALDVELNLPLNTNKAGLEKAMKGHILARGQIMGLYKKGEVDINKDKKTSKK